MLSRANRLLPLGIGATLCMLLAAVATLGRPVLAQAAAPLGQHTVRAGESLFCIGRAYGVLPSAIAEANGLSRPDMLQPEQVLKIPAAQWVGVPAGPVCAAQFTSPYAGAPASSATPAATAASGASARHVVQTGETLYCIGRAYGVQPLGVARANGLISPYLIYPGQTLSIPAERWENMLPGPTCKAQFTPVFVVTAQPIPGATSTPAPTTPPGATSTPPDTSVPTAVPPTATVRPAGPTKTPTASIP